MSRDCNLLFYALRDAERHPRRRCWLARLWARIFG